MTLDKNQNKVIQEVECRITNSKKVNQEKDLKRKSLPNVTALANRPITKEIKFRISAQGSQDYLETEEADWLAAGNNTEVSFFSKR